MSLARATVAGLALAFFFPPALAREAEQAPEEDYFIVFGSARTGDGDIYALPLDDLQSDPILIAGGPEPQGSPRYDSARNRIVYMEFQQDGSALLRAVGGELIAHSPSADGAPVWSPNGDLVAWYGPDGENGDRIFVGMPWEEGRRLTQSEEVERYPAFSPDGERIAFARRLSDDTASSFPSMLSVTSARPEGPRWQLVERTLVTGEEEVLQTAPSYLGHPHYLTKQTQFLSSTDSVIAFDVRDFSGETDIRVLAHPIVLVIDRVGNDFSPAQAPGLGLIFNGMIDGDMELFLSPQIGAGGPIRLTRSPGFDGGAVVVPASALPHGR